jgi:hypothetical protein
VTALLLRFEPKQRTAIAVARMLNVWFGDAHSVIDLTPGSLCFWCPSAPVTLSEHDFTALPYPNDSFDLAVFDPPHRADQAPSSVMYGYGTVRDRAELMSNGRSIFGSIQTDDATIYVGDWWSNYSGSGGYLYISEAHAVYLTNGETILLVAALMAGMTEYERSLIPEQVTRIERDLQIVGGAKLEGAEALDQQIGKHNEQDFNARVAAAYGPWEEDA